MNQQRCTGDVRVIYGCDPYITRTSLPDNPKIIREEKKQMERTTGQDILRQITI